MYHVLSSQKTPTYRNIPLFRIPQESLTPPQMIQEFRKHKPFFLGSSRVCSFRGMLEKFLDFSGSPAWPRRMRDAVPDLTAFMLKHWRVRSKIVGDGEV